jgi:hypothetical protein
VFPTIKFLVLCVSSQISPSMCCPHKIFMPNFSRHVFPPSNFPRYVFFTSHFFMVHCIVNVYSIKFASLQRAAATPPRHRRQHTHSSIRAPLRRGPQSRMMGHQGTKLRKCFYLCSGDPSSNSSDGRRRGLRRRHGASQQGCRSRGRNAWTRWLAHGETRGEWQLLVKIETECHVMTVSRVNLQYMSCMH